MPNDLKLYKKRVIKMSFEDFRLERDLVLDKLSELNTKAMILQAEYDRRLKEKGEHPYQKVE